MKYLLKWIIGIIVIFNGCTTVKPYQRQYIKDPEMEMTEDAGKSFDNYARSIRQGSTNATGTKSSGGCGCN